MASAKSRSCSSTMLALGFELRLLCGEVSHMGQRPLHCRAQRVGLVGVEIVEQARELSLLGT